MPTWSSPKCCEEQAPLKVGVLVTQPCLTVCDPMDCSPPGFSVHGILQARILDCTAIPFSFTFTGCCEEQVPLGGD